MPTFPAINPDEGKVYSPGTVPTESYVGPGGVPYLFRLGTVQVGAPVELPFTNRPFTDIDAIWNHYTTQELDPFDLPSAVWCANSATATIAGVGVLWRYQDMPSVERISPGWGSITVRIISAGNAIGATVAATPAAGLFAGIVAGGVPSAPPPPTPVADPPIVPATTTVTGPPDLIFAPFSVLIDSGVELIHSSVGFPSTGVVGISGDIDLIHSSVGFPSVGTIGIGGTVDLSIDP